MLQSNINSSNTDGSFTMVNSNTFLSPYEILPIHLGIFFLFYHEIVHCVYSLESPYRGDSNEYSQHTILCRISKRFPFIIAICFLTLCHE